MCCLQWQDSLEQQLQNGLPPSDTAHSAHEFMILDMISAMKRGQNPWYLAEFHEKLWILVYQEVSWQKIHTWIHMYMNSFNHFIYEFIQVFEFTYMNSYMNSYMIFHKWIHMCHEFIYEFRCAKVPDEAVKCQLVSSKWQKSHCQVTVQENCIFAVCGADLGSAWELKTNSLRQRSFWICLSTSFSLWNINPQALICTVNCQTWVWAGQVFKSLLTWSNKRFEVSSYGIEKDGQEVTASP